MKSSSIYTDHACEQVRPSDPCTKQALPSDLLCTLWTTGFMLGFVQHRGKGSTAKARPPSRPTRLGLGQHQRPHTRLPGPHTARPSCWADRQACYGLSSVQIFFFSFSLRLGFSLDFFTYLDFIQRPNRDAIPNNLYVFCTFTWFQL